MAGRAFVSRFSPNRTDPAVLEAIFVQRERHAEVWLERLRDSILSGAKHHLLAIGPRGCGKSHLVALLVSRLRKDAAIAERVRIAWLPEDETTPSFWKFLLRILRALNTEYGDEFPSPPRDQLADAADNRRAAVLTDYLLRHLGERTLLVVVENLDDAMRGLKDEGQKRWRAFLQEHPVATTLATAQQLTEDVSDRDRPFFGFFQIEHLKPLTADEALSLLQKIAAHGKDADLVGFLQTPTGRARVRAIRHLAGGSHRVFIILSEFATREKLDDLVTAFEELLDELTPYYQERLRWLPDQQREIVEFLCRQARTVPVKEIAGELYLSEQTAAAQLKGLKEKGYVAGASVGRESRYELAEPLMRLCVEVKDPQREPIRLIVDFLRVWYDRGRVEVLLGMLPADAEMERRYFNAALCAYQPGVPGPVQEALDRDLEAARASGDPEEVVRVLVEMAATTEDWVRCSVIADELFFLERLSEALIASERRIELNCNDPIARNNLGVILSLLGRHAEGLTEVNRAIALDPHYARAWSNKGAVLNDLGRHAEALIACDRSIELDPDYTHVWKHRGRVQLGLGHFAEATNNFRQSLNRNKLNIHASESLVEVLTLTGNWHGAEQELIRRFTLPRSVDDHSRPWHLPDVLTAILRASSDRTLWAHRVGRLVEIAAEAKGLPDVADSLVRSLTRRAYAEFSPETLDAWAGVWHEVAQRHPDLSLAVRLFGVGVRYLKAKDERVLLDLLQEERAILRDLFGLAE